MFPAGVAGIADRPPMGWNSWYAWGRAAGWPATNETNTKLTADLMVTLGLRDSGYRFLVVDDSWENTHREEDGSLMANPLKFPTGMEHVSAYVRAAGLELGLYTTPGNYTCSGQQGGGEPGSFGHVQQDVELWVGKWQIGYLKNCVCNTTEALRTHAYSDMKAAITSMNKSVVYECDPFMDRPWATLNSVCNVYAVSDDIADSFEAWTSQVDARGADAAAARPAPAPAGHAAPGAVRSGPLGETAQAEVLRARGPRRLQWGSFCRSQADGRQ